MCTINEGGRAQGHTVTRTGPAQPETGIAIGARRQRSIPAADLAQHAKGDRHCRVRNTGVADKKLVRRDHLGGLSHWTLRMVLIRISVGGRDKIRACVKLRLNGCEVIRGPVIIVIEECDDRVTAQICFQRTKGGVERIAQPLRIGVCDKAKCPIKIRPCPRKINGESVLILRITCDHDQISGATLTRDVIQCALKQFGAAKGGWNNDGQFTHDELNTISGFYCRALIKEHDRLQPRT
nr:hypothetical protein [Aliiroseovarius zhejiangensis]